MKYLSTRDLRNRPGVVREMVQEGDVILTANGKPVALIVPIEDGDIERTAQVLRRARAQLAVAGMRRSAEQKGSARLTGTEIEAEIRATRRARRRK
jgi:prevent-host-death family protein